MEGYNLIGKEKIGGLSMICILKASIVTRDRLKIISKGTIMETVTISDQKIQLIDVMDKGWKLDLAPEEFMNEDVVEILEGGV